MLEIGEEADVAVLHFEAGLDLRKKTLNAFRTIIVFLVSLLLLIFHGLSAKTV